MELFRCLVIVILIILCWKIWQYLKLRTSLSVIPGPKSLPFIGLALQMTALLREDRLKWFNNTLRQFNGGICVMWFGTEPHVFICKPWQFETVGRCNSFASKSNRSLKILQPWLGNGLITSKGENWINHRRLITPAFSFGIIENYAIVIREKTKILNECIQAEIDKNPRAPINVFNLAVKYTLDTICEAAMGINMDTLRKPNNEYVAALNTFIRISFERIIRPWLAWDPLFHITKNGKEQIKAIKIMQDFTEKVIKRRQIERKQKVNNKEEMNEFNEFGNLKRKAFLDLLLDETESTGTSFTLSELREEVDTFMFAGHDTSASAISWSLFALGNAPEIQAKVHEELKEVFGNDDTMATTKQLGQLKYLDRVIKESLRIYPTVPEISRNLNQDIIIDDHLIPKGTEIQFRIYEVHHDPEVWEDPEKFDPDRFLPENSLGRRPYTYIPFSTGPRNCIGQKLALLQLKITLTAILRKWRVTSVLKPSEIKLVANLVLKPHDNNIPLIFTPICSN